ncbi:unnamed protein product [Protopolystoma xenopodis]|uniref:Uncharacterized protein n=1 Tax=Protopolystoma xenopodis TaxID=117903 RepID=A0A448WQH6_9PLAT|nr:unnamed protein product [Protopolystoma xenopodis]
MYTQCGRCVHAFEDLSANVVNITIITTVDAKSNYATVVAAVAARESRQYWMLEARLDRSDGHLKGEGEGEASGMEMVCLPRAAVVTRHVVFYNCWNGENVLAVALDFCPHSLLSEPPSPQPPRTLPQRHSASSFLQSPL